MSNVGWFDRDPSPRKRKKKRVTKRRKARVAPAPKNGPLSNVEYSELKRMYRRGSAATKRAVKAELARRRLDYSFSFSSYND